MILKKSLIEVLSESINQWIFGVFGTAALVAIAYYVLTNLRKDVKTKITSKEEHLVEFDKMTQNGALRPDEFKAVKKNLGREIAYQTKAEYQQKEAEYQKNEKN